MKSGRGRGRKGEGERESGRVDKLWVRLMLKVALLWARLAEQTDIVFYREKFKQKVAEEAREVDGHLTYYIDRHKADKVSITLL